MDLDTALLISLAILLGAVIAGFLAHFIIFKIAIKAAGNAAKPLSVFLQHSRRPTLAILPLLAVQFALPVAFPDARHLGAGRHATSLLLILAITWALIRFVGSIEQIIQEQYDISNEDNRRARRVHTQADVLARVMQIIIGVIGVGIALMTFPEVRQFGVSMLASAGIAGIVVGMAARPTLANLIAGVQIALTQPITLDDVVIMEGEWGRIEEITSTYVVVRIWDERRLIVPLTQVVEQPFQNWTRKTSDLLGTGFLYLDYTVPVEALRDELQRVCEASDLWDGRVCKVQVTDTTERTMQVRLLVSAANASKLFDLRCLCREKLIDFIQREHPGALPIEREVKFDHLHDHGDEPDNG